MEYNNQRIEALRIEDGTLADSEYNECTLHKCDFSNAVFDGVKFVNCVFEDCALRNVSFRDCSMLNAAFERCTLLGLDWSAVRRHGARLSILAKMRGCSVKYNTFIDMTMTKLDFSASALRDCYFQECALKQADFRDCDLENTVFHHCDLSKADFRDARKYAINVMNNTVTKAKFSLPDAAGLLSGFDVVLT